MRLIQISCTLLTNWAGTVSDLLCLFVVFTVKTNDYAVGFEALHEAVRAGQIDSVKVLLKHGGDINRETYTGVSPLRIALDYLGEDHEMTRFLEAHGAIELGPDL